MVVIFLYFQIPRKFTQFENHSLSVLYGNFFETKHKKDKFMTSKFDSINMTQFLYHTAPPMIILRVKRLILTTKLYEVPFKCRFNMGDCPKPEKKLTRFGLCYFYNFDKDWVSEYFIATLAENSVEIRLKSLIPW